MFHTAFLPFSFIVRGVSFVCWVPLWCVHDIYFWI